ncbi:MAG TPA: DUF3106 domain-containing protein [Ramlibacter sp.]|uniref:DUF3106 domain-containing protein n=1 Tax=Ramlibacter sp. TaxID=1917967 RepID=UPI002D7F085A|nr:DUF3106 domain-containing protein [Ramlibacter sp.]HET8748258.1 DUF3106 domain-containing protein [Ramlibacter sp.]
MSESPRPHRTLAAALAAAGLVLAAAAAEVAVPPNPEAPAAAEAAAPNVAQANKPSVSSRAPIRPAQVRNAPAPRPESSPTWAELSPQQQQSLAPLSGTWRVLGEAHKRKWLALSQNYPTMPPGEQARLHSRMAEWAALSPQQRTLARLNFAESSKLNRDDKRAQWEAYQNLSPEEKRRLAAGAVAAKPPPPPTAVAVKPVPQQKLARIPKPRRADNGGAKLAVVPGRVDSNTLLPRSPAPTQP